MDVYFPDFPRIDVEALQTFVNESDPGEDPCTIEKVDNPPAPPDNSIRLEGYSATLGDFTMMILVHSVPSPASDIIDPASMPEEQKKTLAEHEAFALLSNFGGEMKRKKFLGLF